jgi:hypothetical protein
MRRKSPSFKFHFTLLLMSALLLHSNSWLYSQTIVSNPITGTNPNTNNPYTTGQTVAPNISFSGIGRSAGITGNNAQNSYNARSWDVAILDPIKYFYFTISPNSGYEINFISFVYIGQRNNNGPLSVAFRSSIDGFSNNIGTATITGTTIDLSGAAFQGINSTIEFRLYAWGASNTNGEFSVDDFTFSGNIACVPITADAPADVTACDSYTLPVLTVGDYFTESGGGGTQLNAGDVITSTQTIYVYAETGTTPNCTDENSFTVTINNTPDVDDIADQTVCDSYTLPVITGTNLTGGEAYYTASGGAGTQYNAGDAITSTVTLFIYDQTGTTPNCSDEESFTITVNNTPDVDDIADQTVCDSYTLPVITGTNLTGGEAYYTASGGAGTQYNAGDAITSTVILYIYDQTGTTPNCPDEESFTITVNNTPDVDDIADQTVCDSYTLPLITGTNLTGGEAYYTASGGAGTQYNAGDAITSTVTLYIYDETGTTPNCSDEESFTITVNNTPDVDDIADQTVCDSYTLPVITGTNLTGGEAYYTASGGAGTQYNAGDAITSTVTLYIYDQTGTTPNCPDEESFTITVNNTPDVDDIADQTVCDSYTLPVITGTNLTGGEAYYTASGGAGTQYNAGDAITSTVTLFIYDQTGTTPNCPDEESFTITVNNTPDVDDIADQTVCDSYTLPLLTGTNLTGGEAYYTASGGAGTQYNAGDAITSTVTLFIYDETGTTPNCPDEESFTITVNNTPDVDDIADQTVCDSYTLPVITGTNLTGGEAYYTALGGAGTQYNAGDAITSTVTLYIYDQTGTTPNCPDEESFTITVNNTPDVDDIADQTVCDSYTLPVITGTNLTGGEAYYTASGGAGTQYNAGDAITSTVTLLHLRPNRHNAQLP